MAQNGVQMDYFDPVSIVDEMIGMRDGSAVRIEINKLLKLLPGEVSGPTYETLAELTADLTWSDGSVALVWRDDTVEARGLYRKSGDVGAGSWERYADPPLVAVMLAEARDSEDAAAASAQAAAGNATATAADRVATGQDAAATADDRIATGQDATATAADRVATGQDAAATAADRISTGNDATAVASNLASTIAARDAALSAFANFQDQYLGMFATDPTNDIDGSALDGGELYFNSASQVMKVYSGTEWLAAYVSAEGVLLVANNLSDLTDTSLARQALDLGSVTSTAAIEADAHNISASGFYFLPAGTTNSPSANDCHATASRADADNISVTATDVVTGDVFTCSKTAGVWGAWSRLERFGVGQTLQDVTASRAVGTYYQNTLPRPIGVFISGWLSASEATTFGVGPSTSALVPVGSSGVTGGWRQNVSAIIPEDWWYRLPSGAFTKWSEMK